MPRIAKADVNRALETAAKTLITIGGNDGRISRAEVKNALATDKVPRQQQALVDIFFKFIDNRDFRQGAQVTPADVKKAVAYAKEHMVAKYDLDNNGLSKDEVSKMSLTGKRAVDLAVALKGAAQTLTGAELAGALKSAGKDANYMSESDYSPVAIEGKPANASGVTDANIRAAFGATLKTFFKGNGDHDTAANFAMEIDGAAESKKWIAELAVENPDADDAKSAASWGALKQVMDKNLTDVRVVKVGPKDERSGGLASDHGLYSYMLVGKTADGKLAGVMFGSVET